MVRALHSQVAPTPDGAVLHVTVPCRTSPDRRIAPARHEVRIHPDWRVDLPHDLDAERIAEALGGYCSCIALVERAVPALREWVALMRRSSERLPIERDGNAWVVAASAACCTRATYPSPTVAARHARSTTHIAMRLAADPDVVSTLAAAARISYGPRFELPIDGDVIWSAVAACRDGIHDVEYLFTCGLRPERLLELQAHTGRSEPLTRQAYLALAGNDIIDGLTEERTP